MPKLVERLRESYKNDAEKPLTRRTGWKLLWDVRRSQVTITEQDGTTWVQKVGEMPPNVQEIIAKGGIVKWVQSTLQTWVGRSEVRSLSYLRHGARLPAMRCLHGRLTFYSAALRAWSGKVSTVCCRCFLSSVGLA
jgi:hypothetical protein